MTEKGPSPPRASFTGTLTVRKKSWSAQTLVVLIAIGAFVSFALRGGESALFPLTAIALILVPLVGRALIRRRESTQALDAKIDANGIAINGELIPKREIRSAYLQPAADGTFAIVVELGRWRSMRFGVANEAEGDAILEALALDPSRATARFRIASGFDNKTLRAIATFAIASAGIFPQALMWKHAHPLFALWLAALAFVGIARALPTRVTVGADGILIEKRGQKRFVSFSSIRGLEDDVAHADAIVIRLTSWEKITLRTRVHDSAPRRTSPAAIGDEARALRKRVEDALAAFRNRESRVDVLSVLDRRGQRAADWIESLKTNATAEGYRVASVSIEQLWRVLEDPSAAPADRAAALVALRASLDDGQKLRVRNTIEACAEPRLRAALDAAIDDKEAELEAALDALASENENRNEAEK